MSLLSWISNGWVLCGCWYCGLVLLSGPNTSSVVNAAFTGWVDPDSTASAQSLRSFTDDQEYRLIMSDEFNRDARTFNDGDDPMWTGIDRSDDDQTSQGRRSLHFYNSTNIRTENGSLVILTTSEDTKWRGFNPYDRKYTTMARHFRSGMVQSWNKFCFTGGILEVRAKLPGRSDVGGLWPAVWLLGNLGRATFEASTNLMWPWSYPTCDRKLQHGQEISGCDVTAHYNMHPGQGRGATEIDVVEVMAGPSTPLPIVKNFVTRPYNSMTLQV
jgi:beta-glucan synthesis-associated protein KRE6